MQNITISQLQYELARLSSPLTLFRGTYEKRLALYGILRICELTAKRERHIKGSLFLNLKENTFSFES